MTVLRVIAQELVGLFVDDSSLAVGIVIWVGLGALVSRAAWVGPLAEGGLLTLGLLALLAENVWRSARHARARRNPD